jgi:hypothetical protein
MLSSARIRAALSQVTLKRLAIPGLLFAVALLAAVASPAGVRAQACSIRGGFLVLHDLIPAIVGDCTGPEQVDPVSYQAQQPTTRGLLFRDWRNGLDTFTNGSRTWVRSTCGVQERAADARFPYEVNLNAPCQGATPLPYVEPLPTRTPMATLPPRGTSTPTATPTRVRGGQTQNDATARCADGAISYVSDEDLACSGHGGVAEWLND